MPTPRSAHVPVALLLALALLACKKEEDPGPRYATEFTAVTLDPAAAAPLQLAVQACAGLENGSLGGSAYVLMEPHDDEWLVELDLSPADTVSAEGFLATCVEHFPTCVTYDYATQQELLPSILSAAAALGAVPLDEDLAADCGEVVFDASAELASRTTPHVAAEYVFEQFGNLTTGLAMLNPGYDIRAEDLANPPINRDMPSAMVDFVFSHKLFVTFLINGCVDTSPEYAVLHDIVNAGHWPTPLGVYGYNNSWLVGGYVYEAQTRCLDSRNMGAIPTETGNLSFFATRRPAIEDAGVLQQNPREDITYDPARTYAAFVIGDGDNIRFIMTTRNVWLRQRLTDCADNGNDCPPLTWSISPHLPSIAPDVLEWYYARSQETGHDYFTLPPSGHLYAYPSSLRPGDQNRFVAATEEDARILDLSTTVHWDWFETWGDAEATFLPKYAHAGNTIKGFIPVNVPYMADAFPWWPAEQFYKVLEGDGGRAVVFRPRQWRGVNNDADPFFLSPQLMADELANYPRGTVTAIYMTSDGGLGLQNSFIQLQSLLPDHVQLVSADTAARLALEAAR